MNKPINQWSRIIAHVDMDSFFASIEQRDYPELRGRPVVVTNGEQGSCIITRSYEARRFGVTTGMRLRMARRICPDLVQIASRPEVYAKVSTQIMMVLESLTPDLEIFSVDEAFLDFSRCRGLFESIRHMGCAIQQAVYDATHLKCSVGLSGDKTTAKVASKYDKPYGMVIIPPEQTADFLKPMPINVLCGVAKGVQGFLAQYGVYHCGDMTKIPISVLAKRFGHVGRRIWLMAQGQDPEPLQRDIALPKTIGHGKVMPPGTKDRPTIMVYFCHMAEKVARRLRAHYMVASQFFIGFKTSSGWVSIKCRAEQPTQDGHLIYKLAYQLLENQWQGQVVCQCQITALNPCSESGQLDLFHQPCQKQKCLHQVVDKINQRFGQSAITNGITMQGLSTPDVISPAWRPTGHRNTIGDK